MASHNKQRMPLATASGYLAVPGVLNIDDARRLFLQKIVDEPRLQCVSLSH